MSTARLMRRRRIWYVVISYVDEEGRARQKWESTHTADKQLAMEALLRVQQEIGAGVRMSEDPTVAEWLRYWLEDVTAKTARKPLSPKTADDYRRNVEKVIIPRLGDIRLRSLRAVDCQQMYSQLLAVGWRGTPMRRSSVRYIHATLRAALHAAEKQQVVLRNVAALADAPEPDEKESARLLPADAHLLIEKNQGNPWLPYFEFGLLTGLRRGELLGLHWEDVDFEDSSLTVQRQRQRLPRQGGVVERAVKSKAGVRVIALPARALDLLRKIRAVQSEESLRVRKPIPDHVFSHRESGEWEPWSPEAAAENIRQLYLNAGMEVPAQPTHILRHTHLSAAGRVRMPLKDTQIRAGHSDPKLTLKVYQHSDVEGQRPGAEAIADLLLPPQKKGTGVRKRRGAR